MMKISTRLDWLEKFPQLPTATMLYPFTGIFPEPFQDPRAPMARRYQEFMKQGRNLIELVAPEEADFLLFPFEWYGVTEFTDRDHLLTEFFQLCDRYGKKGVVSAYGDQHVDLKRFSNAIVLQSNVCGQSLGSRDRVIPSFIEDLRDGRGPISGRKRSFLSRFVAKEKPSISFCGFPGSSPVRAEVLQVFADSRLVKTKFVTRQQYYGGAWDKKLGGFDFKKLHQVRRDYIRNLESADYVLCVRGWGNYSARFYEALCFGKIPVLIDTDCVFPFEDEIDYDSLWLKIDARDLAKADRLLAEFDESLDRETFLQRQHHCREAWKTYMSPEGFFGNVDKVIQDRNGKR